MRNRPAARYRRTARHALAARGQAVALDGFRLIGERILDASAEGVLLACDDRIAIGESVILSFPVPNSDLVFDAEAEVVRIVRGERDGDRGYCAGLRFVDFDRRDRLALGLDLRSLPLAPRQVRWGAGPRAGG
ncbi:MAG: PilZ domain-containing protein [Myxococcota bacterium]|nr:PilZ domain-containing protein [Myxococcota bacterium]